MKKMLITLLILTHNALAIDNTTEVVPQDTEQEPIDQDLTQGEMLASAAIVGGAATGAMLKELVEIKKKIQAQKAYIERIKQGIIQQALKNQKINEKRFSMTDDFTNIALDESTLENFRKFFPDLPENATIEDLSTALNKKFYTGVAPKARQGWWARFKKFIKGGLSAKQIQEIKQTIPKTTL